MTENDLKRTVRSKLGTLVEATALLHKGSLDIGSFNKVFADVVNDISEMIVLSVPVPLAKSPDSEPKNIEFEFEEFSRSKESFIAP